ncbi:hypothetical protein [Actinophytocola algeriensis]|uniref:Uncharacterized protein n=1 Tax=Actinophytocola algeriensis TaxID=1768010 RepID=A0A7W7QAE2_9PSEU|nr:hypothetical protein [Actinophytocola algeriensis]MBB4909634.1 hypothetical protein [Actinophytocola algeriensis]MBE1475624.1 hypothetical protein [Actinophytocola algeriensis]
MTATENPRPRLRPGFTALLVIVTVANVAALVLAVAAWSEESTYGGDLTGLGMLSILVTVAALAGIAGAWLRRPWGPPLYFAAQAMGFLFLLFAAPDAITLFTFVPLALAGLLWFLAG